MPVDVPQVRIGADVLQPDQIEQMQRRSRIVSNRSLVDFDRYVHAHIRGHLSICAEHVGGHEKILLRSRTTRALRDLLAASIAARSIRMCRRADHGCVDNTGTHPARVANRALQAFARRGTSDRMR